MINDYYFNKLLTATFNSDNNNMLGTISSSGVILIWGFNDCLVWKYGVLWRFWIKVCSRAEKKLQICGSNTRCIQHEFNMHIRFLDENSLSVWNAKSSGITFQLTVFFLHMYYPKYQGHCFFCYRYIENKENYFTLTKTRFESFP